MVSICFGFQFAAARAHVMKKILLRVTGIAAEVSLRETMQPRTAGASPGKIKLAQGFHDPDIHRERRLKTVCKEQDAIVNLRSHAGELEQFLARLCDG